MENENISIEEALKLIQYESANFKILPLSLKQNEDFNIEAIKHNKSVINYVLDEFKNNREFMLKLIIETKLGSLIEYSSKEIRDDREIVIQAVSCPIQYGKGAYQYISERLRKDKELFLLALKHDDVILEYASKEIKADKEIIIRVVENNPYDFQHAAQHLKEDKDLILKIMNQRGDVLMHISNFNNDKDVVLAAINNYPYAFKYVSDEFKNSKEMVNIVITTHLEYCKSKDISYDMNNPFKYTSKQLRSDKSFMYELWEKYEDVFLSLYLHADKKLHQEIDDNDPVKYLKAYMLNKKLDEQIDSRNKINYKTKI